MQFRCFPPVRASGAFFLLAIASAVWPSSAGAQIPGGYGASPSGGGYSSNNGIGSPGGILGNLTNSLPGTGMGQQFQPPVGMSPTGRFYNYDLITGSGQLSGPLPIVSRFSGIGGMRTGGMMGGMNPMMGGMNPMMGGMNPMMGGMNPMMGGMGPMMGGMNPMMGGGLNGGGLGAGPGQNGGSAGSRQNQNFALLPPGVQMNIGYNTLIGMPMTQATPGMGMPGMGMPGMGMPGMGMPGMGMRGMGGKRMMMMGNGGYGL